MAAFRSSTATVKISHREVAPAGNAGETSLPLTLFDMPWLFYFRIMRRLLFYRLPISTDTFTETIIPNLVTSLSLTLKHFLPLAGNLVSPSDCSAKPELRYVPGDSVSVTFMESSGDFDSLTGYHPRDVNDFYPFVAKLPEPKGGETCKIFPVLAVQVTLFPGFGICIGTTHHHVVGDGNAMASFARAWAMISKLGGDGEFIAEKSVPFCDRTIIKDPYRTGDIMFEEIKKEIKVEPSEAEISTPRIDKVRATYIMRRRDIENLKNLFAARRGVDYYVSGFTVTCAYIWTCWLKAEAAIGGQTEEEEKRTEYFCCVADCRSRLNPPLPASFFGNCVVGCRFAKSRNGALVGSEGFVTAAELIGEAIRKSVNDEEWILREEFWLSEFKGADPRRIVAVAGYPRMDLYGADFGWGKAEKVEFVSIDGGNSISLCMCRDSEGDIEVGLAMPRAKMEAFAAIFADGLRSL
ncbi:PREDICTED: malonyl-coenzyme:anthocyanin 5-O-glucoside-6'''-O-malonyltransferase-like [Ipomoea nil]|uniref:malonyl-coenzyme:anthocyanin 5-O-glucoside-6'''-O-malonyltransferase-like n=1 Tax=Ipomoea nil TaxID=35883 RepID=UPI000900FA83|nr:PREDICTED: malonyl-coenzyme:anthocyanin 5-O-glucoside-6'''-O-malonyltransferase-like [Ipomoea nil]